MFPKQPPEYLANKEELNVVANVKFGDKMNDLRRRLKALRTEALKRTVQKGRMNYAKSCGCCGGSETYHYCIDPYCASNYEFDKDDCLHFNEDEMMKYNAIRYEYLLLLREAEALIKTGIDVRSLVTQSAGHPHGFN